MGKKIFKLLGVALLLLLAVLVIKTAMMRSRQLNVDAMKPVEVSNLALEHLSQAIRIPTVSFDDLSLTDTTQFAILHTFLRNTYPLVYQHLSSEQFNGHAILFRWDGTHSDLKPVILMAHQDVVPAETDEWEHAPFSGDNDGTYIWGRGTIDDKGSLISILEAAEMLLSEGFQPQRTVYFAFGNDEEVGGIGAKSIAEALKKRGVEAEFVLDEGMVITSGMVPMVKSPVALVGTSEKGYLSVELICEMESGHASAPQPEMALGLLAKTVNKLVEQQPDAEITQPVKDFIHYVGPEIPWPARIVFANDWLFGGLIKSIYKSSPGGNAIVRTTTAPTIFEAGVKENVIPAKARAVINFRLLPGTSSDDMLARLTRIIADERIHIRKLPMLSEPSPVSPVDGDAFHLLHKTVKQQFPGVLVVPTIMTGTSDSRSFRDVSPNIYRFAPYRIQSEDLSRFHGKNERISIENYKEMIGFYYRLIRNVNE